MGLLRLLLALSVVASHTGGILGSKFVGNNVAVESFYIISGFYMTLILNEKYIGVNGSYKLFITNRLIRLYPVYWTVLLLTILACFTELLLSQGLTFPVFDSFLAVNANFFSFSYLILTNIFIFGLDMIIFMGINPDTGILFFTAEYWNSHPPIYSFIFIPQAWTLGLELTFYLLAPFLLRKRSKLVFFLIIASLALRFFMYDYLKLREDPWTYRFLPTEFMFFLLGYVSYLFHLKIKELKIPAGISSFALFYCLFLTIVYPYLPSFQISYVPFSLREILYFFSIVISIPLLFNFLKKNSIDNKIGDLSYPVYISHILVLMVCEWTPFLILKTGWAVSLITLTVSYFLNKIVAAPIEKYRQSRLKLQK